MSEPLSPERLAEIREREQAATKGPWQVADETVIGLGIEQHSPGSYSYDVELACVAENGDRDEEAHHARTLGRDVTVSPASADAQFIAAARTDVPDLLAEVDRLRAALSDAADQVAAADKETADAHIEAEQLRVEAERLRKQLAEAKTLHDTHAIPTGEDLPRPIDPDDIEVNDVVTDRTGTRWMCESMGLLVKEGDPAETRIRIEDVAAKYGPFWLIERPERVEENHAWPAGDLDD